MFSQPSPLGKHCARSNDPGWRLQSKRCFRQGERSGAAFCRRSEALGRGEFGQCLACSTGETHGNESQATLHWRWQESSRFHIHYVFYPPKSLALRSVKLGAYNEYVAEKISDHVPLAVDLDFVRIGGSFARNAEAGT